MQFIVLLSALVAYVSALPPAGYFQTNQLSPSIAYGSNLCTNAGGTIDYTLPSGAPTTNYPSNLVIPGDCLPSASTNQAQCQAINQLWATKFNYCCPLGALLSSGGPSGAGYYPQLKENDPRALGPFPHQYTDVFGVTQAAKWAGKNVGCHMFYACNYPTKDACKAAGSICVWQKNVCVENPAVIQAVEAEIIGR